MAFDPPSESCGVGPSLSTTPVSSSIDSITLESPTISTSLSCETVPVASCASSLDFSRTTATAFDSGRAESSSKPRSHCASTATDVWYFLRPLDTEEVPSIWPNPATEPRLTEKPTSEFVGCKLCTKTWKTWRHRQSKSMTSCYRTHFQNSHQGIWELTVQAKGLKGSADSSKQHGPSVTLRENGVVE
ncbi:hypothetical protein BDQ17DRAFT_1427471 [Cyathus striatus]|nr:hypothetical protein BDQ17DRAFT_1427471 [Cyathus striatus]